MDQLRLGGVGGDGRYGLDLGVAHDDGVALHMAEALVVADDDGAEDLLRLVLRHGAGDHAAAGVFAVELNLHIALGDLAAVGEQTLGHDGLGIFAADELGVALRGVDAANLHGVHLDRGALLQIYDRLGVHHVGAGAFALAIVLFGVVHVGIFADVEGVHTVVTGLIAAAVVDAAAGHDVHVAVLTDVEVVVDHFGQARLADNDGDVALLTLRAVENADVNALLAVRLGGDLDMLGALPRLAAAVLADVERADGLARQVGDLFQQSGVNLSDHCSASFLLSRVSTGQDPIVSAMMRGKMSSVVPRCISSPLPTTMISSARLMMRS